jgi:hypothetical protein
MAQARAGPGSEVRSRARVVRVGYSRGCVCGLYVSGS